MQLAWHAFMQAMSTSVESELAGVIFSLEAPKAQRAPLEEGGSVRRWLFISTAARDAARMYKYPEATWADPGPGGSRLSPKWRHGASQPKRITYVLPAKDAETRARDALDEERS